MIHDKKKWDNTKWPPNLWLQNPEWQMEYLRASSVISDKYKFIFIHITKNGGHSMAKAIFEPLIEDAIYSADLDHLYCDDYYKDYFKFTFVRNPWDRMVSSWSYKLSYFYKGKDFKDFLLNYAWDENGAPTNKHWLDQHYHTHYKGNQFVDFIGKFENIYDDWDIVCQTIGLKYDLPHKNESNHDKYQKYYDQETKEIVESHYAKDIELFNYRYENEL